MVQEEANLAGIITRARGGDEEAFATLVADYGPRVFRFLVARGLSHHDAEDITQETFVRCHQSLDRYDHRRAFTTWIFCIASRLATDLYRRQQREGRTVAEAAKIQSSEEEKDGGSSFPAEDIWKLARSVLSGKELEMLWLHYGEEMPVSEVARATNHSQVHVRVILHRARKKLAHVAGRH